jgi:general stress protein 26
MTKRDSLSNQDAIDRIWELMKSIDFCMFATWDGDRQRARPLSARPRREEDRIYFLTDAAGAKDDQIERFPKVTLTFADIGKHNYMVALTGDATVSNDRGKIAELWTAADKAWWEGENDPSIRLISVEPHDAELWYGPNRLIGAAKMLVAAVTGAKPEFGENRKVGHL